MSLQVSTKFKEMILGEYSFANIFAGGRILIYSGTQPTSADHAVTGVLLAEVTTDGLEWAAGTAAGLQFTLTGPYVGIQTGDSWKIRVITTGTAGWFRLVAGADAGAMSFNHARIDGSIGTSGSVQMVLDSLSLTSGATLDFHSFNFTLPPIVGA